MKEADIRPAEQYRDAESLLKMIFGLSTNFISLPPEDVDDGINDVLKAVGMFGGVDRSAFFNSTAAGACSTRRTNGAQTGRAAK